MRRRTCIEVDNSENGDVLQELHEYFLNQGMDAVYTLSGVLKVRLYADTPEFTVLMDELRKRGLEYGYLKFVSLQRRNLKKLNCVRWFFLSHMKWMGKYQITELLMKRVALIVM